MNTPGIKNRPGFFELLLVVCFFLLSFPSVHAFELTGSFASSLEQKKLVAPELSVSFASQPLEKLRSHISPAQAAATEAFSRKYGRSFHVHIDPRSGVPTSVIGSIPLLPGTGRGNNIRPAGSGRTEGAVDKAAVEGAVKRFLLENREVLNLDVSQIGTVRAEKVSDSLWQVQAAQELSGIKVRRARLALTISHGNIVVFGTERWGDVRISTTPAVRAEEALGLGFQHAGGRQAEDRVIKAPLLEIVPVAPENLRNSSRYTGPVSSGYEHRLIWTFTFRREPQVPTWEVMLDAQTGELLAFTDINQYLTSNITGGVYPLSNTGLCPSNTCCGTMQADQPMPYADTGLPAPNDFTGSAGLFDYTSGDIFTRLRGRYVTINDSCGPIYESVFGSEGLHLGGANGDHDCVSGGLSAGNTPAARTAFYEINRIQEMARSYLPGNAWLQGLMTVNLNLDQTCNAYFNGADETVNFFKSGDGCRNTGEIAGVFDHEWGHALDYRDGNGLSDPSEAYADIAAMYRLQSSCMGYGFFESQDKGCGMTADGTGYNSHTSRTGEHRCALNCSGVRETDWTQLTNPDMTPDTPANFACTRCGVSSSGYNGPCGMQAHCESAVDTQAAWDFAARDLQGPPFNYAADTAFIIASRTFYHAAGNIGSWHTCACDAVPENTTSNGCGATNAYIQWLAADDDDGDINNGTPHMTALYNAFNRHGIACDTPAPVDSGCAGGPAEAPVLNITPGDHQHLLSWTSSPAATQYWVFRTEGPAGCDFGKTLIATVSGNPDYSDLNLANDRQYCYSVMAASSDACYSPASSCICATPMPPTRGVLQGTVSDLAAGSPLQLSVIAATGGYITATDSSGFYMFKNLPAGSYDVSVSKLGYRSQIFPGVQVNDGATIVQDALLEPLPLITVQGTVSDGSGHGWPLYARLDVTAVGYSESFFTDPVTGSYSLRLYPDSPYTFVTGSTGYTPGTREVTTTSGDSTEDFVLSVDPETCAPGYGMLYNESFEESDGGYTTNILSDWEWGIPTSGPENAHSGVNVWATNLSGSFIPYDDFYVMSPVIDLSQVAGKTSVLSWWHWLNNDWGDARATVEVSNNGGASWSPLYLYQGVEDTWTKHSILLSTSYAVSTFRIRFRMTTGDFCTYAFCGPPPAGWYIDDVSVKSQGECQLLPGGLMVGTVRDALSGGGIIHAPVTDNAGHTALTQPTPGDSSLDDGFYSLFLSPGSHDITVAMPGYQPLTVSGISISADTVHLRDFELQLNPPLEILTETLPTAFKDRDYYQVLEASGGIPPYTWGLPGMYNYLPEGLYLDAENGVIYGSPTGVASTYNFTLQVTDATATSTTRPLSIDVLYAYTVSTGINIHCTTGLDCSQTLPAAGGTPPYAWAVSSGALPAGLELNSGTGVVSGIPESSELVTFTVTITDFEGAVSDRTVTFTIYPAVIARQPQDNAEMVPRYASVEATFSDRLDPVTVADGDLSLSLGRAPMALAAGCNHAVALKNDGKVVAWGFNDYAQTIVPGGLSSVAAITAGCNHSIALRTDGTLVAWGDTSLGQTSVPVDLSGVVAVSAGAYFSMALKDDGTVAAWGWSSGGVTRVPEDLAGVVAISGGEYHALALKNDGTVVSWGDDTFVPPDHTGIIAISAGAYHNLALKSDGTLVTWGWNNVGQTTVPEGLTGVVAIAAGSFHSVALKSDGTVAAWGWNEYGQATVPDGLTGVVAIAAGGTQSFALTNDGRVVAWGVDANAQARVPVGLRSDGNVVSGTVTYDEASRTVIFTPSVPLAVNATYYATVSGIMSQSGVPLAAPVRWSFRTYDLDITTVSLADGATGTEYSQQLTLTGGLGPYVWSISSGSLPEGLSLQGGSGLLSGTPLSAGTYSFTVEVTDVNLQSVSRLISLRVNAPLSITTTLLPVGVSGAPYSRALAFTGGLSPYQWTVTGGVLPDGLTLNSASGLISGIPTVAGDYSFSISAVCPVSSDTRDFVLKVTPDAVRIPAALPRHFGLIQSAYNDLTAGEETLEVKAVEFIEDLLIDRPEILSVNLMGGLADDYGSVESVSVLRGVITIRQGAVVVDRLMLAPK